MAQPNNPPTNPVPGAIYVENTTGITWVWTGVAWLEAGGSDGYNAQVKYGMALTPGFYTGISGGTGGQNLASIATVYGTTPPVNPSFGQTWVDTSDPLNPITSVWTSPGQWTKTADGVTNTSVGTDAPTSPDVGDTWYEVDTTTFYVWDGGLWRPISGGSGGSGTTGIISYATAPVAGAEGSVYYNSTENILYVSNGSTWEEVLVAPDKDTNSITALTAPTARVDGSALQAGDLWVDTAANQLNYYDASAGDWIRIASASAGDTHSFYQNSAPATRPDGSPLIGGDFWVNSANSNAYVWTSALWTPISFANEANTNSIVSAVAPSVRPGSKPLVNGDVWINSVSNQASYWNGTAWVLFTTTINDTHSIISGGAPIQRPDGTALKVGDLWTNPTTLTLSYYNGTNWFELASSSDTQSIYQAAQPTLRPNGDPLQVGDMWVNSGSGALSVWSGTAFISLVSASDTHSIVSATAPTVRPNGSALLAGDMWVDTDDNKVYYRTSGGTWQLIAGGTDTHSIVSSAAPTLRTDGTALLTGDMWVDSDDNKVYYRTSGGTWQLTNDANTHSIISATSPTTRPDGSSLQVGDLWINATDEGQIRVWTGGSWQTLLMEDNAVVLVSATAPTRRTGAAGGSNGPLQTGDLWVDSDDNKVYYRTSGGTWTAISVGSAGSDTNSIISTGTPLLRADGTALVTGDNWVNPTTRVLSYYNGGAWTALRDVGPDIQVAPGGSPTTRSDGTALQTGDLYITSSNHDLFYRTSGGTWQFISDYDTHSILSATTPATKNDGRPLGLGDIWIDTDDNKAYYRNPSNSWVAIATGGTDTNSIVSATAPTVRADGSALQTGDLWVDSDDRKVYYRTAAATWLSTDIELHTTLASNAIDVQSSDYFSRTVSAATTFTFTNAAAAPIANSFILKLTNGGNFTVTWPGSVDWAGGTAPTLTTNGVDILGFFSVDGGTTWYGMMMSKDAK